VYAYARPALAVGLLQVKPAPRKLQSAFGRARSGGDSGKTRRDLREKLAADLLKTLVVNDAALGQNAGPTSIYLHADFAFKIGSARSNRVRFIGPFSCTCPADQRSVHDGKATA
jgi:hypothetical protein